MFAWRRAVVGGVAVEAVSAYWHFVDVIWILLFSVIYLLQ